MGNLLTMRTFKKKPGSQRFAPLKVVFILGCGLIAHAFSLAQAPASQPIYPMALVERAAANELLANENRLNHSLQPVRFKLYKQNEKGTTTKEVVQTKDGTVTRLLTIDGKPLTEDQEQEEGARLERLMDQPETQERRKKREQDDAERSNKLIKIMPLAFLYTFQGVVQGPTGPAIKLSFQPNPHFVPPDTEARIAVGIAGELLIDKERERMVRLDAHLFTDVDFGWGFIGRLYKGGNIRIENADIGSGNWQLVHMKLDLAGKALMVKSLTVRITEDASDFEPVARGMDYKDAIRMLQHVTSAHVQKP